MSVNTQLILSTPSDGVFRPGQPVTGIVKYNVPQPTKYKHVKLKLKGKGKCDWTTGFGRSREDHCSSELCFSEKIMLWNKPQKNKVTLHGQYEHPFTFVLSEDIPGTYQDDVCSISYQLELEFEKAAFFNSTQKMTKALPVYSFVNPTVVGPTAFETQKKLFSLFGNNNRVVGLKVVMENSFLVPGQNVRLSYVVSNNTDVDVMSVWIDMYCYTTYKDILHGDHKIRKVHIERREGRGVPKMEERNGLCELETRQEFFSIQHSKVLKREYIVMMTVRLPSPHSDLTMQMPIVIGHKKPEAPNVPAE